MEKGKKKVPIFSYAIISDTHIRPSGESSSPWKTNLLTNERARWITQAINNENPDLVIHLGDIVHPVPHQSTHASASNVAQEIMGRLSCPYYLVPGNHDVGDKDNPTVPAHIVNDDFIGYFHEHYGASYQSFEHKGIHFIILNSPVLNSGLKEESLQREWLEKDLEEHKEDRVHIFSHYPPYLFTPDEPSNYDNLDQPERQWLLELIEKYRVEAFYAGHVHQFFHKRHHHTDIYNMLSTGNLRQDYANLFRVEAAEEYGRNDVPKMGYAIVDVYEDGTVTHIRRSFGETLAEGETLPNPQRIDVNYPHRVIYSPLGVQLRYPLAEVTELPNMGPLDEFIRKKARNDYTFLALWETGIRSIRLTLSDLIDEATRERLTQLHEMGMRYGFFTVGIPEPETLLEYRELVDFIEIIIPWENVYHVIPEASKLRKELDIPVYVANIESSVHKKQTGPKYSHYISHGFRLDELSRLDPVLPHRGAVDGFVFEVGQFDHPLSTIHEINTHASAKGYKALVNIRLAPEDPAEYPHDDIQTANRVAEAAIASYAYPDVSVLLDTFMDHDRGYFPRIGLYDRRLNPRRSAHVLRSINAALDKHGSGITKPIKRESGDWSSVNFESNQTEYTLNLPITADAIAPQMKSTVIDLTKGVINPGKLGKGTQHLLIKPIQK